MRNRNNGHQTTNVIIWNKVAQIEIVSNHFFILFVEQAMAF